MKTQMTHTRLDLGLDVAKLLGGAAAGALLMYMLDPERGSARRARSAAAVRSAGTRTSDAIGKAWTGAGARFGGAAAHARDSAADLAALATPDASPHTTPGATTSSLSRLGQAAGDVLDETVTRAKQVASRASDAASAAVAQAGAAASQAGDAALDLASRITRRARHLDDSAGQATGARMRALLPAHLPVHLPVHLPAHLPTMLRDTVSNPALVGGGLLGLFGLARRSPLGLLLGLAGAALLARGITGKPLHSMLSEGHIGDKLGKGLGGNIGNPLNAAIDVEESIHIDAAPEDVYDLWANYDNFPRFMSHVVEVEDLGRRRSHWVVKGPGGARFAWYAVLTAQSRPHRLAWRSEPGADIPQSGSVQFEARDGGTLVTVRMSYTPPAGVLGHGVASLLGADPKTRMEEDLARMKAFIEGKGQAQVLAGRNGRSRGFSRFLH